MPDNIQKVILTADNRTKSAFASFRNDVNKSDSAVNRLQKTSRLLRTGLGALGITVSGIGFTSMIKDSINAQDSLAKLSKSTGLAVETLAGLEFAAGQSGTTLERVSKGVNNFSKIVLEANGGTDKYSRLIKALGLDLETLKNATPEEQFISLAGAIKNNVSEQERGTVITALLGQRYTELVPLLSQGEQGLRGLIEQGQKLNPVTAESAAQSEAFNDNLDKFQRSFSQFSTQAANTILPSLVEISEKMSDASREGGTFQGVLAGLSKTLDEFSTSDFFLDAVEFFTDEQFRRGVELNIQLEKIRDELGKTDKEADNVSKSILDIVPKSTPAQLESITKIIGELNKGSKKTSTSTKTLNKGLTEQEKQAQKTKEEIERLTVKFDPLIAHNKELNELVRLREAGLADSIYTAAVEESLLKFKKSTEDVSDGFSDIDEQVVKLNETTRQLFDTNEQIVISGVRGIQSALSRGLFNFFDDGLSGMVSGVKNAVGQIIAEFASVKLLQSTGLIGALGLGSGAAFASGGAGSGISAFNIASLGTSALNLFNSGFGIPSLVSGGVGAIGNTLGISALSNFAAGASGAASAGVFGAGGIPFLGGGIGSAGTAAGVVGTSGGVAAGLGSSIASFAGPAVIAAAVDFGLRQLFGDKKIGGTAGKVLDFVPVIGPLINGLFGLGAPKFNREELVGTVGAGGFEGALNTGFKQKGGAFKSSRFSNFIIDTDSGQLLNNFGRLSESGNFPKGLAGQVLDPATKRAQEVGDFLDETFISLFDTLKNTAEILGISQESLKNFNFELDLISEKGETLSEQQISDAIADISNQMVESLIPGINELSRSGESATDTLQRFGAEFKAIETGFILSGESVADARAKTQGLSFEQRSEVTDRFGGAAGFQSQLQNFFDNVLDESQQLEIVEARLDGVLEKAGIDFIPTLDQLVEAFRDGTPDVQELILQHDDLIIQYQSLKDSADGLAKSAEKAANEERALANERNAFTAARREAQAGGLKPTIATTIGGKIFTEDDIRAQQQSALSGAFEQAKSVVEEQVRRLDESMRNARDMIRDQISGVRESVNFFSKFKEDAIEIANSSFAASKAQLDASLSLARAGADIDQIDTPELANAINTLKQDRSNFFSSRKEFELDKAQTAQTLRELSLTGTSKADQTIDLLTNQLNVMQDTFDLESRQLNATLDFINFQGGVGGLTGAPSGLNDADLERLAANSLKSLNLAERIQRNTSFNGSVQFPFPTGTNESADAADARRLRQLNNFVAQSAGGGDVTADLKTELSELKKQITENKEISEKMYDFFLNLTPDGRSLRTTT